MAAEPRSLSEWPFLMPLVAALSLVGCVVLGVVLGLPVGLLAGAGVALGLVITLVWQSLSHLSGEAELTLEEAFSLAAPTTEEEQKRAVLRALKDLEYELRVGKISQADYLELSARYRADAKRLILAVDERLAEQRAHAERLLDERLNPKTQPSPSSDDEGKPKKTRKKAASAEPTETSERGTERRSDAPPPTQSSARDDDAADDDDDAQRDAAPSSAEPAPKGEEETK